MRSFTFCSLLLLTACVTDVESVQADAELAGVDGIDRGVTTASIEDSAWLSRSSSMPSLPHATGGGVLSPWGGSNASNWRPEAILANAVSDALNRAWRQDAVSDVTVSVPVHMLSSTLHEYGDGQTNAAVEFPSWTGRHPPLVAMRTVFNDGSVQVRFWVDASLQLPKAELTIHVEPAGSTTIPLITTATGMRVGVWVPPSSLGLREVMSRTTILVRPTGWLDWFPVRFHFPVRSIASLKASVPVDKQRFQDGGDVVDHERVSAQSLPGLVPYNLLMGRVMGSAYNQTPYTPSSIHARFPSSSGEVVTGVGRGWTWVAQEPAAPFKVLYTCFEQRRPDLEASAPNGGVVSGGGWHLIGDAAETILNDLEPMPIAVAFASRNVWPASLLPSGSFAYGLADVATVRFLKPGEAFVTARGGSLKDTQGVVWPQDNFHWFFFQQDRNVCTEEWVHPCVPDENLGFACAPASVPVTVEQGFTSWGQDLRVVGNIAELGAWNPANAPRLLTSSYPTWKGQLSLPRGVDVQFKLVKVDASGNAVWESGSNRVLAIPLDGEVTIQATWR